MPRSSLIVGCGYVGLALLRRLKALDHRITGWVRSAESASRARALGADEMVVGSAADPAPWSRLADRFDFVFQCASTGGTPAAYTEVYLEGARQIIRHQPQARRLFVSSTSVYGQDDGSWVDETSPTEPVLESTRVLLQAEREAAGAGAVIVRAAGIYGPGRTSLLDKYRDGTARLEGDGSRYTNHIHRDDLAGALVHLTDGVAAGEVYNAADDEPVTLLDFHAWCARAGGRAVAGPGASPGRRTRVVTNKRVSNRKLRGVGWAPAYPSFREGFSEARSAENKGTSPPV